MSENLFAGVVIRVKNIELCRSFYRDVLALGNPVMDSNFWIEFSVNGSMSLFLEKVEWGENIPLTNERVAWMLQVPNLQSFSERLENYGYHFEVDSSDRLGFKVKSFKDPEGNVILVTEMKPRLI